jgi:HD-GYP domain-containing protein (c-di-GMP phosphodiesterase class II)
MTTNKFKQPVNEVKELNKETETHSQRVGVYTMAYCLALGIDSEESEKISVAAITHDLGKKFMIEILEKESKLTDEEFDVVKKHPQLGHDELIKQKERLNQSEAQFKITLDVALSHHEAYDGSGYPNGLKGSEIPTSAQIVSIIDVFDALSTKRGYKEPWDREEIEEYFEKQSGTKFNKAYTDCFVENLDMIYMLKRNVEAAQENDGLDMLSIKEDVPNLMKANNFSIPQKNENSLLNRKLKQG